MIRHALPIMATLALFGCGNEQPSATETFAESVQYYRVQIEQSAPTGSTILALCGPSEGRGFYVGTENDGWIEDDITNGRIALVELPTGELDMYFRGADGVLYSARREGGSVSYTYRREEAREFGVLVRYERTGVVETHNFLNDPQRGRINLWTTNKNIDSIVAIRKASAFIAECVE